MTQRNSFLNVDVALSKYIMDLRESCKQEFFNFCVSILVALRECMSLYGYDLLAKMQQSNPELEVNFSQPFNKHNYCQ